MTVIFQDGYTLPSGDQPLTHARIAHSGNWLAGGTASASSTASGYFVSGPNNSLTYERWSPTDEFGAITYRGEKITYRGEAITYRGDDTTWTYTHTAAAECDYCAIGAHTLGTGTVNLVVQYSTDGSTWVDLCASTVITTNEPIMVIFEPVTAQYWRIVLGEMGAASIVGVVKFGAAMQMQRSLYGGHTPVPFGRDTVLRTNISETGEILGRTKQRTMLRTSYQWEHLTAAWMRENWLPFQEAIEEEPFFIAWRPETFGDVVLAVTEGPTEVQNMGIKDFMSASLTIMGRGYD